MKDFIKKRLREEIIDGQYMTPAMKTACNKMTIGSYEEAYDLTKKAIAHLSKEEKFKIMEKLRQPLSRLKEAQMTLDDEVSRYRMTGDSLADEANTYWHQIQSTICELNDNNLNENIINKHLKNVIPNRYVYHTSNPIFRNKISKEGLIPKGKSESWLSDTKIDGKVIFAVNSNKKKYFWDSTYDDDIYRIDTSKLNNKWYNDPNFDSDGLHLITFENIPPNSIKLIHKGTFSLDESVNIENPSTDEYNDIIVNGEKVGYVILSPARKEYYWVDVNLPNPLAIVDIKIFNEFRGKKYMTQTMNWLYNFAKDNGYKSLFLRVDDDSEIDQTILYQIYTNYGFKVYKTHNDEDDIFMYMLL